MKLTSAMFPVASRLVTFDRMPSYFLPTTSTTILDPSPTLGCSSKRYALATVRSKTGNGWISHINYFLESRSKTSQFSFDFRISSSLRSMVFSSVTTFLGFILMGLDRFDYMDFLSETTAFFAASLRLLRSNVPKLLDSGHPPPGACGIEVFLVEYDAGEVKHES